MTSVPKEKLDRVVERWLAIQDELNHGVSQAQFAKLNKEFSDLSPLVKKIQDLRKAEAEVEDLEAMIADPASDKEMVDMAYAEKAELGPKIEALEHEVRIALLPKDAADEKSAILEVRAGTGGDEAALFAADLFRMYQRYADLKGWKTEIISMSESDLGGYKEIVA